MSLTQAITNFTLFLLQQNKLKLSQVGFCTYLMILKSILFIDTIKRSKLNDQN